MRYLLDTNSCIAILNDRYSTVSRKLAGVPRQDVSLCQIVKAELYFGAFKGAKRRHNLDLLQDFFQQFSTLPFDDLATQTYGRIRTDLAARGTPVGPNDLIIAAIAVRHGAILVTHNTAELSQVAELRLVDWQTQ